MVTFTWVGIVAVLFLPLRPEAINVGVVQKKRRVIGRGTGLHLASYPNVDTVVHGRTGWPAAFQIGTHADVDVSSLVVGRSVVKMFVAASNFAQARRSAVGYIQAVKIERSMDWQKTEKTVFTVCTSTRWSR